MRLGKNMKHALAFIKKCDGWCGYAKDRATKEAIKKLEKLNLVKTNKYHQFKAV